jgi:Na+-transporting NADH:ubiquinone oxidoreductase subunit NqrC
MKKFYLSTPTDRILGIGFSLIMSAVMVLLVYVLRSNLAIMLLIGVFVTLVLVILAIYVLNVGKAACIIDPNSHVLRITGVQDRSIDLDKVACLQTIPVKSGHIETRSLAFTDAEGDTVAIVPTYFCTKRGVLTEPMAMGLAKELNIQFQANVPAWYYDKEARKIHDEEERQKEKEEAKADRERRIAARAAKLRKKAAELKKDN